MLAVVPAARGLGLGEALVRHCMRRAREDGCTALRLSTEPIMHPEKYLRRERPLAVKLPARPPGSGWKRLSGGAVGEFDTRELMRLGVSLADATTAATGREISAPRVYGTTQKVQNLSQPSCTVTKAEMPRERIASGFGWGRKVNLSSAGNSVSIAFAPVAARASNCGR